MKQVTVIGKNDFPYAVFEDAEEAKHEAERLNTEDKKRCKQESPLPARRIFYHLFTVPFTPKTT